MTRPGPATGPDIPPFPVFRPIELADRAAVEAACAAARPEDADYLFPNLFAWRHTLRTALARLPDCLAITYEVPGGHGPCCALPLGDGDIPRAASACLRWLAGAGSDDPRLCLVTEGMAERHRLGERFQLQEVRDHFDYLYRVSDLAQLAGRRFDGKRNRIRRVRERAAYAYRPLTADLIPGCRQTLAEWRAAKADRAIAPARGPGLAAVAAAVEEMLEHLDPLGLFGAVLLNGDRVAALTVAGPMDDRTAVVYAELAHPADDSANMLLNQLFCQRELARFEQVNREQDMGLESLRRAKLSYYPCRLVTTYVLRSDRDTHRPAGAGLTERDC